MPEKITKVLGNTNSHIIDNLVKDLLENSYGKPYLEFSDEVFEALKALMEFNYTHIYNNPMKAETERRSTKLFQMLFDKYMDDLNNKTGYIYNEYYLKMAESYTKTNSYGKIVVDFIAGMTDNFFISQFEKSFLPSEI